MSEASLSDYSLGHESAFLGYLRLRNAETSVRFARDRIREDSRILDCGCGPGSITVGLAEWAPKGQTVGIDINGAQLVGAQAMAQAMGVENVSFREANLFDLPFADESFDFVFAQTVFCHIPNRDRAMREIHRVLSSGGHVALRDIINEQVVILPGDARLQRLNRIVRQGIISTGGDPDVGRVLGPLLQHNGFEAIEVSLDWEQAPRGEQRADYFCNLVETLASGSLGARALEKGWCTREERDEIVEAWRDLARDPFGCSGLPLVQALGRKA
ncbi:class I SAM-dependent methyltransferase [Denitrobaculum tricleocarpae]|uniref:Methyltransferase domain-containing protein n=1 Tax=Denitrobaculum tricleocarpae TaxID=2591009 RepID=A0A545T5D3_9PROT|nr:class I SAM-dependent methyltransferase [Denitrobaculum tricleocarpae]TQV72460.1 methyltransferase domain-containing protein [Denitrobaculum tricleocarpae]